MNKYHLEHPTQATACGANARHAAHGLSAAAFKSKDPNRVCKTCAKVLAAIEAGRPVYSGYEDPDDHADKGPRIITAR